ncbi:hypothetical protein CYY_005240 [Polysphondylium violaceum]|uniref:Uncharacterized protein n=1 Tax=Polysphondylium violaceum TaxID=133409 RepID=A0A8J4UYR2_9MYCE|nr:hypothetical protein CYY_005240 [Polysphondylium violaceum]
MSSLQKSISTTIKGFRSYSSSSNKTSSLSGYGTPYYPVHAFNKLNFGQKKEHVKVTTANNTKNINSAKDLPAHPVRSAASTYLVVDDA